MKNTFYFSVLAICLILSACGIQGPSAEHSIEEQEQLRGQAATQETAIEDMVRGDIPQEDIPKENPESDDTIEVQAPSKEEVLAMRETVLEGMSEEEIKRLTENVKVANLRLESAYLNDNVFEKLSDKDSLYWNYFDQKGDIQIGWSYEGKYAEMSAIMKEEGLSQKEFYEKYGTPLIQYNRFDAVNFINLMQDMQKAVSDERLAADLQQLIDLTDLAADTHEMKYANEIYKILHDLDYFLLRYGIEDVGKYTQDGSVVAKYYGVLKVYGAESEYSSH
ncbi:MAG: hypothetical protein NC094_13280 [Bacteroidales bacterium]|nr:hypothetical protein [Lachnoclostridium sp.]MCM1383673.1 hypothetical protein [Lachnoclostridium sp.]MCM1466378.1 hypothetical protein [Bacteroidales bacterium]